MQRAGINTNYSRRKKTEKWRRAGEARAPPFVAVFLAWITCVDDRFLHVCILGGGQLQWVISYQLMMEDEVRVLRNHEESLLYSGFALDNFLDVVFLWCGTCLVFCRCFAFVCWAIFVFVRVRLVFVSIYVVVFAFGVCDVGMCFRYLEVSDF